MLPRVVSDLRNTLEYSISLDKGLAANDHQLVDRSMNNLFAKMGEAIYQLKRNAHEAVYRRKRCLPVPN